MDILNKKNWLVWALLLFVSYGLSNFVLGYLLGVYKKGEWYSKPIYWIIGLMCYFAPVIIMLVVFYIQITVGVCKKLGVPGIQVYGTPYSWIICLIVPIIGWTLGIVMFAYIIVWPIVMLARGEGEKYIKN